MLAASEPKVGVLLRLARRPGTSRHPLGLGRSVHPQREPGSSQVAKRMTGRRERAASQSSNLSATGSTNRASGSNPRNAGSGWAAGNTGPGGPIESEFAHDHDHHSSGLSEVVTHP